MLVTLLEEVLADYSQNQDEEEKQEINDSMTESGKSSNSIWNKT